mmetsp:Transcript_60763/g.130548  ORF Transcript_60763/g.130548 Transcript_60763/m.130548 type:complete len:162 (-) Transcript_60763:120-605(-)
MAPLLRSRCLLALFAGLALWPAAYTFVPGVMGRSPSQRGSAAGAGDVTGSAAFGEVAPAAPAVAPIVATAAALGLLLGLVSGPQVAHAGAQALQNLDLPPLGKNKMSARDRDRMDMADMDKLRAEIKEDQDKKNKQGSKEERVKAAMEQMREMASSMDLPK